MKPVQQTQPEPIPYEGSVIELISKLKQLNRQKWMREIDEATYQQERMKLLEGVNVRAI